MPRIVIAHDWLVCYAGSERCVHEMLRVYPDGRLLTTLLDPAVMPPRLRRAEPSVLQRIPGARGHHELFVPLMPLSWRLRRRIEDADVVVSSSHAAAKSVSAAPHIPHISYCHYPMRYAWNYGAEQARLPPALRPLGRGVMAAMRRWDRASAERVDLFLTPSRYIADQVSRFYGRRAEVMHPPVDTATFTPGGQRGGYFLSVGRLVTYKRADLLVEAFRGLPHRLLIAGDGHQAAELRRRAPSNVTLLGEVSDPEELRDLYRGATALLHPAEEGFGIAMAEAHGCGTPVVGLAAGGALDIVEDGVTGWLIERADVDSLRAAIARAAAEELDPAALRANAERFGAAVFRQRFREVVERVHEGGRAGAASAVAANGVSARTRA